VDPLPQPWRVLEAPSPAPGPERSASPAEPRAALTPRVLVALLLAAALAVGAVVVAATSLAGTTVDAAQPGESAGDPAPSDTLGLLVVDVAGAVAQPGVYRLPAGSRIADAIAAAGGFAPRVDAARVAAELNLAALAHDGDRIVVPARGESDASSGPGSGGAKPTPGLIDLNHASAEALDTLPGIGPVTAAKIVASRDDQPFRTVDELRSRGLVGEKTFDKLKSLVTVG
jgi:competence protein ComEA